MATENYPGIWLMEAFRRGGVDTDRLARQHPAEVASALVDTGGLEYRTVDTLLNSCAEMTGNQSFGLHMVDYCDLAMFGTYGYLMGHAPTVRRLLEIVELYFPTFYRGPGITLQDNGSTRTLIYNAGGDTSESRRHTNEWTIGFFADLFARRIGKNQYPLSTEFTNSAPDDLAALHRIFGRNITFNAHRTAFEFETLVLDCTSADSDPQLLSILTDQAENLLREVLEPKSFAAEVKLKILADMDQGGARVEDVACAMALSRSTFKRRLTERGTTFRKLRDEVILEVAGQALLKTQAEVGIVAQKLGYSELSAFDRSFRRITGMSPTQYRQNQSLSRVL